MRTIDHIKPYIWILLIIVGLHFARMSADLSLPDYMSRIVNIGIQQSGIKNELPEALTSKTFNRVTAELDSETRAVIGGLYTPYSGEEITDINFKELKPGSDLVYIGGDEIDPVVEEAFLTVLSGEMPPYLTIREEYEALGADIVAIQTGYILRIGIRMLLMTLLSVAAMVSVGYISAVVAARVAKGLRSTLFSKIESFSSAEFDKFSTASLITRSTNDVRQIQGFLMMLQRGVLYAPLIGIGGFLKAMNKAPSMAWIIGVAVVILLIFITTIIRVAMPKFKIIQDFTDRLNLVARENLTGLLVVRAFNREKFEEGRFDKANRDLTETNLFVMRVMVVAMPFIMLIMNGLSIGIIWIGSAQIGEGIIQVGDMMAFIQYSTQIVMAFMMLSMMFISLPRAMVSGRRIEEVLAVDPAITDPTTPTPLPDDKRGLIEFESVSFRYPGGEEDAIQNISFTAKPGETTAIIGSTGSGKSTVVNLIPRFYDVSEGSIKMDGVDIRELTQHDLREAIGFVPQKNVLFSGSIESNLKYGNKAAGEKELNEVVKVAQADDFIREKPDGFNTSIAQDGKNVSGGQRQRLAISRALMKKAPLYIFDDSFSALDFKTDANLRRALKENTGESTIIIVAQRVATIMNAEQILVLDDGKIVGMGTHKELLETCTQYREIAQSQLGLEEAV